MDLARAPRRARLTARKKGSGYENESRFVQNLDVRRQTGGPRGVTHQGNANANERVFTVLKDIFDVSGLLRK